MIEGDVWQDIDTGLKQGPTGGTLNANWSYMICNYGPGIIYFKDSGQDLRTKVYREAVPKMFGFKYNWAKEGTVTPEFMKRVIEISSDLKIDPDDLMATIARESRFDPKIQNSSGAYGLIQFTKDSIDEINRVNGTQYSKEDIKKMNAMEQLEMVYLHYKPFAGKMHNLGDVYLVTFAPSYVGEDDDTVLYSKELNLNDFENNKLLDSDKNGEITRGEAVNKVLERRDEFRYEEYTFPD